MNQTDFTNNLENAIQAALKEANRLFYHEYDLEYYLVRELHAKLTHPSSKLIDVSMEYPIPKKIIQHARQTPHVDIVFEFSEHVVPIELKHVSSKGSNTDGFVLYDFLDDISRLEQFLKNPMKKVGKHGEESVVSTYGYALFVTDVEKIFKQKLCYPECGDTCKRSECLRAKSAYYPLRLYNDVNTSVKALSRGSYYWKYKEKERDTFDSLPDDDKKKYKQYEITLRNDYSVQWKPAWSTVNPEIKYHYLLIPVTAPGQ